jgi:hypothetical protein
MWVIIKGVRHKADWERLRGWGKGIRKLKAESKKKLKAQSS